MHLSFSLPYVSICCLLVLFCSMASADLCDIHQHREECCDEIADSPAACIQRGIDGYGTDEFDNCVGGIGVDCEGVTTEINFPLLTQSIDIVEPIDNGDGTVTLEVAVGSILHDLCCMEHPNGAFCHSSNYPEGPTVWGNDNDNDCACLLEWRKAAWNFLRGRTWLHTFDKAAGSSMVAYDTTGLSRKSWLPLDYTDDYCPQGSDWGLREREATAELCAPPGTHLDCPGADANCEIRHDNRCGWSKKCKACASGNCESDTKHTVPWNPATNAYAGDSDYCCSGEFREIYQNDNNWPNNDERYGICK